MRVVDGDTLEVKLNDQKEKVRLISVDTPEKFETDKLHRDAVRTGQDEKTIRALDERASDFTKSLVKWGDAVQLEYDQQPRDKYQRLLASVWLSGGRMLKETIVCEGYGNALTCYPFPAGLHRPLRTCKRRARAQGKGLWAEGLAVPGSTSRPVNAAEGEIKENSKSHIYHLLTCPNYGVVTFKTEEEAVKAGNRKAGNCP